MESKVTQQFKSDCGRAIIYVENDMPIGVFHDFLMHMKGLMVERMIQVHKDQIKDDTEKQIEILSDEEN